MPFKKNSTNCSPPESIHAPPSNLSNTPRTTFRFFPSPPPSPNLPPPPPTSHPLPPHENQKPVLRGRGERGEAGPNIPVEKRQGGDIQLILFSRTGLMLLRKRERVGSSLVQVYQEETQSGKRAYFPCTGGIVFFYSNPSPSSCP